MGGKVAIRDGSSVTLNFAFQDSATDAPVTLPSLLFSIFDLDGKTEEMMVTGYSSYYLRQPESNVVVTPTLGVFQACDPATTCKYHPQNLFPRAPPKKPCPYTWGNPTDPEALNEMSKAGAVTFEFNVPTSNFTVRWGKVFDLQPWSSRMFFAGSSNLVVTCA